MLFKSIVSPRKEKFHPFMKIIEAILVVFICLKLTGVVGWSWWWVMSPVWGGFIVNVTTNYIYCKRFGMMDELCFCSRRCTEDYMCNQGFHEADVRELSGAEANECIEAACDQCGKRINPEDLR